MLVMVLGAATSYAQVVVSEIRVFDLDGKGVKARVIELTRERKELDLDDTDNNGVFNKKFTCQQFHRVFARPIAGPYTQSEFAACQQRMKLTVRNVHLYPQTPVRIITTFSAGSEADQLVRLIAKDFSDSLKQEFVVENKPQMAGFAATREAASSAPDGYTLLLGTPLNLTIYPVTVDKPSYDAPKDFAPIGLVTNTPNVLISARTSAVASANQFFDLVKKNPKKVIFSSPGTGTTAHLAGEQLNMYWGQKLVHVPYKGTAQVLDSIISGQSQVAFAALPLLLPRIKAGEVRALAVTSEKRAPVIPDVPTIAEAGFPDYSATNWTGLLAPAGTPTEIVTRLSGELRKVLMRDDIRSRLTAAGITTVGSTPDEFAALISADLARWQRVARSSAVSLKPTQ